MTQMRYDQSTAGNFVVDTLQTSIDFGEGQVTLHSRPQKIDLSRGSERNNTTVPYIAANGVVLTPSAPSYPGSYMQGNLFSGDITQSAGQTNTYYLSNSTGNQTLTFDFGKIVPMTITKIRVYPRARDDASSNYRILVSDDPSFTTSVEVVPWVINTHDTQTPYGTRREHLVSISNRYVRFELTQNGLYGVTLSEIEFYQDAQYDLSYHPELDQRTGTLTNALSQTGHELQTAIVDPFTSDTTSSYAISGAPAATWTIDSNAGTLTAVGGTYSMFLRNNSTHQNVDIEVTSDRACDSGLVARYQDGQNYYLLSFLDDSSRLPGQNLGIFKVVGGSWYTLATANLTWARGTSATIRFTVSGNRLTAYFNGVPKLDVTDTSLTNAGLVGLFNNVAAGSVDDTTVYRHFNIYSLSSSSPATRTASQVLNIPVTADGNNKISWADSGSGAILQNSYIEVPHSTALTFSDTFTIEAKLLVRGNGQQGIVEKYDWTSSTGGYAVRVDANNKLSCSLANSQVGIFVTSDQTLLPGIVYRVAMTYDSSTQRVTAFINGVPVASGLNTSNPQIAGNTKTLKIGARGDDGSSPFSGILYEVRMWNICRPQADILQTMDQTLTGTESGLVGYWKLDDGAGASLATDSSPNANHGTPHSGVSFFKTTSLVETKISLDNGATFSQDWQPASNNAAIPGLAGTDLSHATLYTRQTLTSDNPLGLAVMEALKLEIKSVYGTFSSVATGSNRVLYDLKHKGISSVRVLSTEPVNTYLRYLVSTDAKNTWYQFDGTQWNSVDISRLHALGMSKSQLESITPAQWALLPATGSFDLVTGLRTTDSTVSPSLQLVTVGLALRGHDGTVATQGHRTAALPGFLYSNQVSGVQVNGDGDVLFKTWTGHTSSDFGSGKGKPSIGYLFTVHVQATPMYNGQPIKTWAGNLTVSFGAGVRSVAAQSGYCFSVHLLGTPPAYVWRGIEYGVGKDRELIRPRKLPLSWHPLDNDHRDDEYAVAISPYDQIAPDWLKYKGWK